MRFLWSGKKDEELSAEPPLTIEDAPEQPQENEATDKENDESSQIENSRKCDMKWLGWISLVGFTFGIPLVVRRCVWPEKIEPGIPPRESKWKKLTWWEKGILALTCMASVASIVGLCVGLLPRDVVELSVSASPRYFPAVDGLASASNKNPIDLVISVRKGDSPVHDLTFGDFSVHDNEHPGNAFFARCTTPKCKRGLVDNTKEGYYHLFLVRDAQENWIEGSYQGEVVVKRDGEKGSDSFSFVIKREVPVPLTDRAWEMVGDPLEGDDSYSLHGFGQSIDMSSDAKFLAVGAVGTRINDIDQSYAYIYGNKTTLGEPTQYKLMGEFSDPDGFGYAYGSAESVFVSDNGNRVLLWLGTWDGIVHVYDFDGSKWNLNVAVTGQNTSTRGMFYEEARISNAIMSSGGDFVAFKVVAAPDDPADVHGGEPGVQVYDVLPGRLSFHGGLLSPYWHLYTGGSERPSDPEIDPGFGSSIAVSRDGTILVIGGYGFAYVHEYGRDSWGEGHRFESTSESLQFGANVAVSDDGKTVAIADGNGYALRGSVTVYRHSKVSGWQQLGLEILGPSSSEAGLLENVVLSENGNTLGAQFGSNALYLVSVMRFYNYNESLNDWQEFDSIQSQRGPINCALSADGMTACCGQPYHSETSGRVSVYQLV